MSSQVLRTYYHLKSKWTGALWSDPPQVIPAALRILGLADLEDERMVNEPGRSTTLTIEELKQFKRDDQILAKWYDELAACVARELLTSHAYIQCSWARRSHFAFS